MKHCMALLLITTACGSSNDDDQRACLSGPCGPGYSGSYVPPAPPTIGREAAMCRMPTLRCVAVDRSTLTARINVLDNVVELKCDGGAPWVLFFYNSGELREVEEGDDIVQCWPSGIEAVRHDRLRDEFECWGENGKMVACQVAGDDRAPPGFYAAQRQDALYGRSIDEYVEQPTRQVEVWSWHSGLSSPCDPCPHPNR